MTLTVGSLFSGIGGLDLGLERAGMNVIWQSEIDPYASKVLAKHWPGVPNYGDIKEINWGDIVRPDILCGGYPCQPFSTAGKRNGTDDPRHLWPWVREAISVLRPRYAILENVRGHVSLGLSTVLGEMASIGYDAEWQIVSAASVGAPHRRDRVIIVAYPDNTRLERGSGFQEPKQELFGLDIQGANNGRTQDMANTNCERCNKRRFIDTPRLDQCCCETSREMANTNSGETCWGVGSEQENRNYVLRRSNQPRREALNAGREWWEFEPGMGRVANGIPNRVDRLKGLGNAVVPQVAELVGRMVMAHAS